MPALVSVIVPAYRAARTLDACLTALLDQDYEAPYEVVLVVSADRAADVPVLPADPRLRTIEAVPRLGAAVARNLGVAKASSASDVYVFTDADVVPDRDWLRRLVAASDGQWCVAGAIRNGTPRRVSGSAEYLVQFLDLHPRRPARHAWHGATANLLVPRPIWQRLGPFPEDMGGGEDTLLTVQARTERCFRFANDAVATHLNRTRLRDVLKHQFEFGRFTSAVVQRCPYYKGGFLVRRDGLIPLAVAGRLASVYARVIVWDPRRIPMALLAAPVVVAGLAAWGAGVVSGNRRPPLNPLPRQ
jgi:glycosyltransferase involved in cell wall biosynthesis